MAAGDLVQVGQTTVAVGFAGLTYGTILMRTAGEEPTAKENPIVDARAAVVSVIYTNPGRKYSLEGVILAADLTSARALKLGSTVTVNGANGRVTAAPLLFGPEEGTLKLEVQVDTSLTLT